MSRSKTAALAAVLTAGLMWALIGSNAVATHQPANKIVAQGSGLQAFRVGSPTGGEGTTTQVKEILSGTLRTSSPTDLLISVDLECALWTQTSTASEEGDTPETATVDTSETEAQVKVWLTIDGGDDPTKNVVKVAGDDDADPGKVVFCNRAQRMDVQFFDTDGEDDTDDQLLIKNYLRTRQANGFEWLKLNLGNGIHTIRVWAELTAAVKRFDAAFGEHSDGVKEPAAAAIGKRILVVEPAKLANDAEI